MVLDPHGKMNYDPYLTASQKLIQNGVNVKPKTLKFLKKKTIEGNICELEVGKDFLDKT